MLRSRNTEQAEEGRSGGRRGGRVSAASTITNHIQTRNNKNVISKAKKRKMTD